MAYQAVFKRRELKYMVSQEQKLRLLQTIMQYMALDGYGRTTIRNVYFDTENYRLVRRSIEKPTYKEKLRIRSYAQATPESKVFVELKKKARHIVYKRRVSMQEAEAMAWICGTRPCGVTTQITEEIDYFIRYYQTLRPVVFLSYAREAFYSLDGSDFRVTFDDAILCRRHDLSLTSEAYGAPILPEGRVLMEIKCVGSIPLWMTHALSDARIYNTSFSKYGTAYQTMIFPELREGLRYA